MGSCISFDMLALYRIFQFENFARTKKRVLSQEGDVAAALVSL